ncbi:hypothetical protein ACRN9C_00580 [Shewanella frigidimarina]|uniref:hypothetical protein n=1 Tax=Shewanella frigidimarina TaxID=56812 RepID=UPI003D79B9D4
MSVFAIIVTETAQDDIRLLDQSIRSIYDENCLKLKNKDWLVFEENKIPPQQVYKRITEEDKLISCLIVPFESYWGVQPKDVWEWLNSKEL